MQNVYCPDPAICKFIVIIEFIMTIEYVADLSKFDPKCESPFYPVDITQFPEIYNLKKLTIVCSPCMKPSLPSSSSSSGG